MAQVLEVFIGLQFGDEGKGKIVDERVTSAKMVDPSKKVLVVRYHGGANAGHTVLVRNSNGKLVKFVTHSAPTGLTSNSDIAIGPDVAFNPITFAEELDSAVKLFGYNGRVLISNRVGILFEFHKLLDSHSENNDSLNVGSTKQGIGPFYQDNTKRTTRITFQEYISEGFVNRLNEVLNLKRKELENAGIWNEKLFEKILEEHKYARERLRSFGANLEYALRKDYFDAGHHIIIEGAQGTGLDVNMGDLPNVTSSHLLAPFAFPNLGLPRSKFKIYGIEKIYPTRVGNGHLPSLATDEFAEIGENAGEVGATTGRKRRVGYPDWVFVKRSVIINDCDGIIITRADNVQNNDIKVCKNYECGGNLTEEISSSLNGNNAIYDDVRYNWHLWDGPKDLSNPLLVDETLRNMRADYVKKGFDSLPDGLKKFIRDHDEFIKCKTIGVSIGPSRGETVYF
ncbi:MAG: adenylosuccinate synthetase [Nanoarchaeota archaeon]